MIDPMALLAKIDLHFKQQRMTHLDIKVTGRVQGVGYRNFTENKAREFQLNGIVRNEADGSVYIEVEGDQSALNSFVNALKKGPMMADVQSVSTEQGSIKGYQDFSISL